MCSRRCGRLRQRRLGREGHRTPALLTEPRTAWGAATAATVAGWRGWQTATDRCPPRPSNGDSRFRRLDDTARHGTDPSSAHAAPEPVCRPDRGHRPGARAARLPGLVVRPEPRQRSGTVTPRPRQRDDRRRDDHDGGAPRRVQAGHRPGQQGVDRRGCRLPARPEHRASTPREPSSTTRRTGSGPTATRTPTVRKFNVPGLPDANHGALVAGLDAKAPFTVVGASATYHCQGTGGACSSVPTTPAWTTTRAVDRDPDAPADLTTTRRRRR